MHQKGTWYVQRGDGRIEHHPDQDEAAKAMIEYMSADPSEWVGCGRTGRRTYWWRGAGGCGQEMRPANGLVMQRFCKFEEVEHHCKDCPNYRHYPPSMFRGVPQPW